MWPKKHTIYLHADTESRWNEQDDLGLSDEAMCNFKYTCSEIKVKLLVNEDGTSTIVSINET